jgi:hypothetical protein
MSLRIWKWSLEMAVEQDLSLPKGAKLLTLQLQAGNPTLWFLCDADAPLEPRRFAIHGTGHPLPEFPGDYKGTFQTGELVWHVFEIWHPRTPPLTME